MISNKILIIVIISSLLSMSCKIDLKKEKNYQSESIDVSQQKENNKEDTNTLDLERFTNMFGGIWLPKNYVKKIKASKSAYISRTEIPEIAELWILKKNLDSDTLSIGSSLNNHEGYGFKIWKSKDTSVNEFSNNIFYHDKVNTYHFRYNLADTTISIIYKNKNAEVIKKINYIRVIDSISQVKFRGNGYEAFARQQILNGNYRIIDSKDNDLGSIVFEPLTGQIKNFKYGFYSLTTDYAGLFYPSNHISLKYEDEDNRSQEYLTMITRNDTIFLYESEEIFTDSKIEYILTEIKYYLINENY